MRDKACALCDDLEQLAMTVMSILRESGGMDYLAQLKQVEGAIAQLDASGTPIPPALLERREDLRAAGKRQSEAHAARALLKTRIKLLGQIVGEETAPRRGQRRSDPDTNTGSLFG